MLVKVVGYQKLDYFSKKANTQKTGVSLHYLREPTMREEGFKGLVTGDVWLPISLVERMGFIPDVGSKVNLQYEFDGRNTSLVGYELVKADDNS